MRRHVQCLCRPGRHGCRESFGSLRGPSQGGFILQGFERADNAPPVIGECITTVCKYDAMHPNVVSLALNGCASPLAISGSGLSGRKADSFADPSSYMLLRDTFFPP